MKTTQRGNGLLLVIIVFATAFTLLGLSLERSNHLLLTIHKKHLENTARNLAEAGIEYAIHQILSSPETLYGTETKHLETGTFSTTVSRLTPSGKIGILSTGTATSAGRLNDVIKTLRVVVQLSPDDAADPLILYSREEN
jgi:hypothetical protein